MSTFDDYRKRAQDQESDLPGFVGAFYDRNHQNIEEVISHLRGRNLAPFWGAGFVAPHIPTWERLLVDYAEHALIDKKELEGMSLEERASWLIHHPERGKLTFDAFLRDVLARGVGKLSASRQRIREIFPAYHLTTNYDRVIESLPVRGEHVAMPVLLPWDRDESFIKHIQQNKPCLIKLHGDVSRLDDIILSEESYDKAYPAGGVESTVQKVLGVALGASCVLFVGCSLEFDRTLEMVRKYAEKGCRFYALLELPQETENKADAYAPRMLEGYTAYAARWAQLEELCISPIFYPYGKHNFVDKFLDLLHREVVVSEEPRRQPLIEALPAEEFVGREEVQARLLDVLRKQRVAYVSGGPGIGKSELSRQALRQYQQEDAARVVAIVDCQVADTVDSFYRQCIASCCPEVDVDRLAQSETPWGELALKQCAQSGVSCLFLDNFEMLNDKACQSKRASELMRWLRDLHSHGVILLVASRYESLKYDCSADFRKIGLNCVTYHLERLTNDLVRRLVACAVQNRSWMRCEGEAFEKIVTFVDGHPLTLSLVIAQSAEAMSWESVLRKLKLRQGDHALTAACRSAWDSLEHIPLARVFWGVLAWSIEPLPLHWFSSMLDQKDDSWEKALNELHKLGLIFINEEGVSMLAPIKEVFEDLGGVRQMQETQNNVDIDQARVNCWSRLISDQATSEPNDEFGRCFCQILHVLRQLMQCNDAESTQRIYVLSYILMDYYMFFCAQSLDYLILLIDYAVDHNDVHLEALANCEAGDCARLLSRNISALKYFERAEALYMGTQNNRGMANILKSRGSVYYILGEYDAALAQYTRAKDLFTKEGNIIGLANTARAQGDVYYIWRKYDAALEHYSHAKNLFIKVGNNLGLANTLDSQGDVYRMRGDCDNALEQYARAEELYTIVGNNLGLANTADSKGDVYRMRGEYNTALEHYARAEELQTKVRNKLGLANTIDLQGEVYYMRGEYDTALKHYARAEELYKKLEDKFGLPNTTRSQGDTYRMRGEYYTALEYYKQAEELYSKVRDNLGLANTLRGQGEVYTVRSQYEIAENLFSQSEELCLKEEAPNDLAELYRALGDLCKARSDASGALGYYQKAIDIFREIGAQHYLAIVLQRMAAAYRDLDDEQAAAVCEAEAVELLEKINLPVKKDAAL